MKIARAVTIAQAKKLVKLTVSVFKPGFDAAKCKMAAKMAVARIKLLRNKREVVVRQMRRDIALLIQTGQDSTARIRVEHVFREQNVLAANELIELFCELVVSRLSIISKQRDCPSDLKEGISSLLFAGPRCSEIPELAVIHKVFEKKYGTDFVSAAVDLRPNSGVNPTLIEKLSVKTPSGEMKLKMLKEIAKEHKVEWDATESEKELLKPPEEQLEGPRTFVSASTMPVATAITHNSAAPIHFGNKTFSGVTLSTLYADSASAAEAAAESARDAVAAAQAAALMAKQELQQQEFSIEDYQVSDEGEAIYKRRHSCTTTIHQSGAGKPDQKLTRRFSVPSPETIHFDESPPPDHPPAKAPSLSNRIHPKLPDYDDLNARFNALRNQKP